MCAVALGSRVTDTIKNGIINIDRFDGHPGVLMLAIGCAEVGNAVWLITATSLGFPVSTTQTIIGSLIGVSLEEGRRLPYSSVANDFKVGFATRASVTWEWTGGSVSQIAASWAIAPGIAACCSALLFATLKYSILERKDSFKWGMRLIPLYLGFTAGALALFLAVKVPGTPDLGDVAGEIAGSVLAVFFGVIILAYVFVIPYSKAKLVREDPRIRAWHIPLRPLLLTENPPLYFPGKGTAFVSQAQCML